MMVITPMLMFFRAREKLAVGILCCDPLSKAVLREDLVAQMPLAYIGRLIITRNHLRNRLYMARQRHITGRYFCCVRIQAAQHRCPRGAANRLTDIGVLEDKAFIGQGIQGRRLDPIVTITGHGIQPLLVGKNIEQIGFHHS